MSIIYSITNRLTGHIYIGQTVRPLNVRWGRHRKDAKAGSESPLHRAIRKHGVENFDVEEICTAPVEWLDAVEAGFIKLLGTFGKGYNATPGGDGFPSGEAHPFFGKPRPDSVGKKISATRIARGIRHDKETLLRIVASRTGKKINLPEEARAALSAAMSGKGNPFFGKKHTDQVKARMSACKLGSTYSKRKNTSSQFFGVSYDKTHNAWKVYVRLPYKTINVGTRNTELEAAQLYNEYVLSSGIDRPLNVIEELYEKAS